MAASVRHVIAKKLHAWNKRQSACCAWLTNHGSSSSSRGEVGSSVVAYVCSQRQYCILSEDKHRTVVTRDLDFRPFEPKINGFRGSSQSICMSSLVILAASVFEISCIKTDKQTVVKTLPP